MVEQILVGAGGDAAAEGEDARSGGGLVAHLHKLDAVAGRQGAGEARVDADMDACGRRSEPRAVDDEHVGIVVGRAAGLDAVVEHGVEEDLPAVGHEDGRAGRAAGCCIAGDDQRIADGRSAQVEDAAVVELPEIDQLPLDDAVTVQVVVRRLEGAAVEAGRRNVVAGRIRGCRVAGRRKPREAGIAEDGRQRVAEVGDGDALGVAHAVAVRVGEMADVEEAAGEIVEPICSAGGELDEPGDRAAVGDGHIACGCSAPARRVNDGAVRTCADAAGIDEGTRRGRAQNDAGGRRGTVRPDALGGILPAAHHRGARTERDSR